MKQNETSGAPLVMVSLRADDGRLVDWSVGVLELTPEHCGVLEEHKAEAAVLKGVVTAKLYCRRTVKDVDRAKKELRDALANFYRKSLDAAATLTEDPS